MSFAQITCTNCVLVVGYELWSEDLTWPIEAVVRMHAAPQAARRLL